MTDPDLRLKQLAELFGWTGLDLVEGVWVGLPPKAMRMLPVPPGWKTDLNLQHQLERRLSLDQRYTYWCHVQRLASVGRMAEPQWLALNCPPEIKFEALIETLKSNR